MGRAMRNLISIEITIKKLNCNLRSVVADRGAPDSGVR